MFASNISGSIQTKKSSVSRICFIDYSLQKFHFIAAVLFRKLRFQQKGKLLHIVSELFQHLPAALLLDIMFSL